jgi:TolA-binding protein
MKSWIFIGILIALMSSAAYFYYSTTQARITSLIETNSTLVSNNITLTNANNQNVQTIEDLQSEFQKVQENFLRIQTEFQIIRSQNNELRERLGRHELDALAAAKPGLVERTVNNASANAIRCFELLSGSPMNQKEINAKTSREANSECPWLFEGIKE